MQRIGSAVALGLGGVLVAGGMVVASAAVASAATGAASAGSATASTCTKADVDLVSHNSHLTTVSVKLAAGSENVSCDVSLHSYETQGPTWETSGQQTFLGFATVHLTTTPQTLSVAAPPCFGQTELVIGTKRYDGVDGPLPHYPDGVFDSDITIATWHGGAACASASVSPTATATGSTSPSATASVTPSVSPSVSASVLPEQLTASPSPSPSVAPSTTVGPSPSASVLGLTLTKPPTSTLPFTGAPVLAEVALGFGLLASGALCGIYAWRRRSGSVL